jgi:hypothetical protein
MVEMVDITREGELLSSKLEEANSSMIVFLNAREAEEEEDEEEDSSCALSTWPTEELMRSKEAKFCASDADDAWL